jgi:outer membrane usher protein
VRDGDLASRLSASGGLVYMDDSLYATKRPNGSVALVHTGQPGAQIYQENRQVAIANKNGEALITGLVPFADNRISVDPTSYKFTTILEDTEKEVTPARSSGVIVDFTPPVSSPTILTLRLKDDSFPPAGARVTLSNSNEPLIVGRHGELFIANLNQPIEGKVEFSNRYCQFNAAPKPTGNSGIPRLGPIYCLSEQDS